MKIEQIIKPDNAKGKEFICDSSQPHIQKFTNLFNDDGKCIFKLMQSNDVDVGSCYEFYNIDGTKQFSFTLDNNCELASYSQYSYENIGKCKKQIVVITNIKKSFINKDVFYLDEKNNLIEPEFDKAHITNEEYLQAQLEIVKQINSKQE